MRVPAGSDRKFAEVEAAASKDRARPSLTEPWLAIEGETAYLEATDSYVAVRIPVEVSDQDTPGQVPTDALKMARKGWIAEAQHVALNGSAEVNVNGASMSYPRSEDASFPNLGQLIGEPSSEFTIALNAEKVAQVAKALGAKEVRISFGVSGDAECSECGGTSLSNLKPIHVEPLRERDGRVGLVMPVRIP